MLYLCAVKDAYSNRIVGYAPEGTRIDSRMKSHLRSPPCPTPPPAAGTSPAALSTPTGGFSVPSAEVRPRLHRHDMVGSMGRVGACGDNAATESFLSLLQKNVLNRRSWATRQELRIAIITWIERTYHRRRRQDALGRLTPIEYETIMTTLATQAA